MQADSTSILSGDMHDQPPVVRARNRENALRYVATGECHTAM